jgi:transcriptional regulator, XRE family
VPENVLNLAILLRRRSSTKLVKNVIIKFPEKKINVVTYKKPFKKQAPVRKPVKRENVEDYDVVEYYAELIKNKREEMQMTQDDLAKKIFERKNVLSNIERGELLPDISTARKLEKVLNIKLLEKN